MSQTMKAVLCEPDKPLYVGEVDRPEPGDGEVLVRVRAAGLNRGDLVQRAGFYPPPPGASQIMGLELSGVVEAVGPGVARWNVGDPVCALVAGGGYAEYAVVHEGSCFPIPGGMTFTAAASLPETMMTVYTNVFDRCALASGETLLVHGGSSGIGVSAIQMAKAHGATVYVTAGTPEKCAACEALGADRAIDYKREDFVAVMKEAGGADVILDMVGGDYVQKNLDILKLNGRVVNIAFQKGSKVEVDLMRLMLKRATLTGSTLRARTNAEKSSIRAAVEAQFWPRLVTGEIKPVVDRVYPMDQADAAQARMASSTHIGKIILEMPR